MQAKAAIVHGGITGMGPKSALKQTYHSLRPTLFLQLL
jgi:cell division protein FtsW (lipid II flippase)